MKISEMLLLLAFQIPCADNNPIFLLDFSNFQLLGQVD